MKVKMVNIVGMRLAKARTDHIPPMTQLDLAEAVVKAGARIDRAGIAKIENGLRSVCDYEVLALAGALAVDPLWLLTGKGRLE